MPTKREIVGQAFAELGIGNWEFDLQPDEMIEATRRLNQMMARWSSEGIRIGYNALSDDPDEDSGLPDVALEAVRTNLALRLGPMMSKDLSGDTRVTADSSLSWLTARFMQIPQRPFPSTLPLGSGNRVWGSPFGQNFYPGQANEVTVGPDSTLGLNP